MKNLKQLMGLFILGVFALQTQAQTISYRFQKNNILSHLGDPSGHLTVTTTLAVTDGYYILGNIKNYSLNGNLEDDIFLAHVDTQGIVSGPNYWVKTYGQSGIEEIGTHLIQGWNGELVMLGEIRDPIQYAKIKTWILRLNPNGSVINSKELSGDHSGSPVACSARGFELVRLLGPTGPDGYALCGYTQDCIQASAQNPFVTRLDNNLNQVWFRQYNNLHGKFFSIIQRSGGLGTNFVTVGTDWDVIGVMAEIDYSTGALVTNTSIPGTSGNFFFIQDVDYSSKVINTPDGGFLVGSSSLPSRYGAFSQDFMLHKFNTSGVPMWGAKYTVNNINSDVQLEDIESLGDHYNVLLSSQDGLIISRVEINGNHSPVQTKLFETDVAQTSFARVAPSHGYYQKLHFDYGHLLAIPQQPGGPFIGNGLALASHFTSAFSTGGIPSVSERQEFRLIKTDMQLNTGHGTFNCGLDIGTSKGCSWDSEDYYWASYGCGNIYGNNYSSTTTNLYFNYTPDTTSINAWNYQHCIEEDYFVEDDVEHEPDFRKKISSGSIEDLVTALSIEVYPNPAKDVISISGLNDGGSLIRIRDVQGKEVLNQQLFGKTKYQLDLSLLKRGMYFVEINQNDEINTIKIIKE